MLLCKLNSRTLIERLAKTKLASGIKSKKHNNERQIVCGRDRRTEGRKWWSQGEWCIHSSVYQAYNLRNFAFRQLIFMPFFFINGQKIPAIWLFIRYWIFNFAHFTFISIKCAEQWPRHDATIKCPHHIVSMPDQTFDMPFGISAFSQSHACTHFSFIATHKIPKADGLWRHGDKRSIFDETTKNSQIRFYDE